MGRAPPTLATADRANSERRRTENDVGYCDLQSAMTQLGLDLGNEDDAADIALLQACDEAVSLLFEEKAGYDRTRSPIWGEGVEATATTKTLDGERFPSAVLMLPVPARTVEDIAVVGQHPETITEDQWTPDYQLDTGEALGIRRIDGASWPVRDGRTRIQVTAVWADGPIGGTPPAVVVHACTFLAVDEFRTRKMSPAGEIGPDGFSIRPRNPWNFELVKTAIEAVRVPAPVAVF